MAKKKAEDMRDELRQLISFTRGPSAWQELINMEAQIRKDRQKAIYDQKERQRKFIEYTITGRDIDTYWNNCLVLLVYYESKRNDLMGWVFVCTLIILISALLGFVWWMDEEQIHNPPRIPETETEKKCCSDIKERIKVAEWKLKRLMGEQ